MDIKTFYQQAGHSRLIFRDYIIDKCGITIETFYTWKNMRVLPGKLDREAISEYTKIPVEELFPQLKIKFAVKL